MRRAAAALVAYVISSIGLASAGVGTWTPLGPNGGAILSLVADPTTPDTLYAGTSSSGVFKSVDGGSTWSPASTGLPSTIDIRSMAIDPVTPTTLYVATREGVFRSTDGAQSWSDFSGGLSPNTGQVVVLRVDPVFPTTLYAGLFGVGIYKRADATVWTPMNEGLPTGLLNGLVPLALVVDPVSPQTLYLGLRRGGSSRPLRARRAGCRP
jgi:hypothetical protein